MTATAFYPIGTPGQPWNAADIAEWRSRQLRHRSYEADVSSVIERLRARANGAEEGRVGKGCVVSRRFRWWRGH